MAHAAGLETLATTTQPQTLASLQAQVARNSPPSRRVVFEKGAVFELFFFRQRQLARELTKIHEEVGKKLISEWKKELNQIKGECVLLFALDSR